jgi:DNA repair protein RadA/Sms
MAKKTAAFACRECGDTFARWAGRCPSCSAMNAIAEISAGEAQMAVAAKSMQRAASTLATETLAEAAVEDAPRLKSGLTELDRVLGGGLPRGAVVLLGGEPGIGKSTLLAQVAGAIAKTGKVLYVTAEESATQVRSRLQRLQVNSKNLDIAASNDAQAIAGSIAGGQFQVVVVDSIQLLNLEGADAEPGSVTQVRGSAALLAESVKRSARDGRAGTSLIIIGHVTKDGSIAGPRLLEHLVDTVLSFEGDRYQDLRVLRALKNRYGSTNELGLFRMTGAGLEEVADPTGLFIADRDGSAPGSCVVPTLEGNRCLLVEIQALVNPTDYPQPARRVSGLDGNRVAMIIAVLSRRLRYPLGTCDIFVNVTGGAHVNEPAADLGIALAIASAWREIAVPTDLVAIGEVGLGGELRPASRYDLRATEARRLGFQRLLGPGAGSGRGRLVATKLSEAIELALVP